MLEKVKALLLEVCGDDSASQDPDLDLFASGLLDSLGFLELLVQLEEVFAVSVSVTEVDRSQLSSVNKIVSFLQSKGIAA